MQYLVRQTFRQESGALYKNSTVFVTKRPTGEPVATLTTDDTGSVNFYSDAGTFNFTVNGKDIPFDILDVPTVPADSGGWVTKVGSADALGVIALERRTDAALRLSTQQAAARFADAAPAVFKEAWTDTAAWTGAGTVLNNRMYTAAGLTRPAPAVPRWTARATLHATGAAGKFAYFGLGSSSAGGDLLGIGQGSASTAVSILRGANIPATNLVIPRTPLPALAAGDYLCTLAVDETYVSMTIQPVAGGQAVYGARIPKSAIPGGVINTIFLSANDTVAGGLNWGPLVVMPELALPPASARTVGGTVLFGAGKPLVMMRADTTGIGHVISIPGDGDSRIPVPVAVFLHQSLSGTAMSPWTETRMANVLAALEAAGYAVLSSDNGPGIVGGGTQDKFSNQASLDDYVAAVGWARSKFSTGQLFLLGPSQGSFVAENLLARRRLGGIAAVATISGGSDLITMDNDPAFSALLRSAYGVADHAGLVTAAGPYNPIDFDPTVFRGVPFRFYVGGADPTAVPAVQVTPFKSKIERYVPESDVVTVPGVGHLDNALYQGADLVAFFERYR